ncbi:hypothetical protein B484DRAFT_420966 [Ochromonadaceae sp. CCMP2298]|nr:hypothetical protein B484DRAFT_420966 [Ochromonadaceae sp. CCMP2298]
MKFRPCIDIHNGVVKQIVGSSLTEDAADAPKENFAATVPASDFAERYRRDGLFGGHVIMLGGGCEQAAMGALAAFPGGLQLGGGVTAENADSYLQAGASHVIVTSYVFRDGQVDLERLRLLSEQVGRDRLVVDLSCRKRQRQGQAQGQGQGSATTGTAGTGVAEGGEDLYYVVTNKWTKYTDYAVT